MVLTEACPSTITSKISQATTGKHSDDPELELVMDRKVVSIRSLTAREYWITTLDGLNRRPIGNGTYRLPLQTGPNSVVLHFGEVDKPHRVAVFEFFPESRV
jgi:hypothetical protein